MKIVPVCKICGRELSDPFSIAIGIGPICRMESKNKLLKTKPINMFATKSQFDFGSTDQIIWMRDEHGYMSLTNDMETAIQEVINSGENINKPIMYCDSEGIWDRVVIKRLSPLLIAFEHLGKTTFAEAEAKLLSRSKK